MGDNSFYGDSTHNQFVGSNLSGGQTFIHLSPGAQGLEAPRPLMGGLSETTRKKHEILLRRREEILESLEPQMEKSRFLSLLSPGDQGQHLPETPSIDPEDPKFYWIFKNLDFEHWESANDPQILWLLGPPDRGMREVASYLAKKGSSREGNVFKFSSSVIERSGSVDTAFVHSILYHILSRSGEAHAKLLTRAFLGVLLYMVLERGPPASTGPESLLKASGVELWRALMETVNYMNGIQVMLIAIDGVHRFGQDGAHYLQKFCEWMRKEGLVSKMLLTCRVDSDIKGVAGSSPCIEYDKERQGYLKALRYDATRYGKIEGEYGGSLQWLWAHEQYTKWSASQCSGFLYVSGKPGSGKSTLAKYFRENLAKKDPSFLSSIVVDYFYTFRGTKVEHTHENMLRSVLYGILEQDESFFFHFQTEFRRRDLKADMPYESLQRILSSLAQHPVRKRLYFVLDAMDESDEKDRRRIIELLCQLCSESQSCVFKIFLASRPISELEYRKVGEKRYLIQLENENTRDISRYIHDFLRRMELTGGVYDKAARYTIQQAKGVFVWVHLVREELLRYHAEGYREREIFDILEGLPTELESFYQRMLHRLENGKPRDVRDGVSMLQFTLFAQRPPTIEELNHFLAISGSPDLSKVPCNEEFQKNIIQDIEKRALHCGGNFLEVKSTNDGRMVQIMHQTAREYLFRIKDDSKFYVNSQEAHRKIAVSCIRYLALCFTSSTIDNPKNIQSWTPKDFETYVTFLSQWPLVNYALQNLADHLRESNRIQGIPKPVPTLLDVLVDCPATRFLGIWMASLLGQTQLIKREPNVIWNSFYDVLSAVARPTRREHSVPRKEGQASEDLKYEVLNAAAKLQLSPFASAFLTVCTPMNEDDLPLVLVAAAKGHEATMKLLLESGVDVEIKDSYGRRALHHAVRNEHEAIIRLLLEGGAERAARDNKGRTALHLAVLKWYDLAILDLHMRREVAASNAT